MRFDRVIPHNDGAGVIEAVSEGVTNLHLGGIASGFTKPTLRSGQGMAAEFVTAPVAQVVSLPNNTDFAAGACLGIPAMTAHYCVFVAA